MGGKKWFTCMVTKQIIAGIFFSFLKRYLTMTLLIPSAEMFTKRAAKFALNYTIFFTKIKKKYIISNQDTGVLISP